MPPCPEGARSGTLADPLLLKDPLVHLSRRQRRRVVSKFRNGSPIADLSTEFGITVGQVRALLEEAGEDLPQGDRDRAGLIEVFAPTDAA